MSIPVVAPSADLPVVIVGAGPAGLAAARALLVRGIPYVHLERHDDVGGIWDLENPGTPMYRSAHFISSRDHSGFFDYPMPSTFADYPSREQILQYARSFADDHGLREQIRFGSSVQAVSQDDATGEWTVTTSDGDDLAASAVICCTGVTWTPRTPHVPGDFAGETRHSVTYVDPSEFAGRRVLVVGLGNSGADIACDAAANADRAFISTRRGYHFIPKHIMGKPSDGSENLPIWAERLLYRIVAPLMIGDVRRWGLPKPDHRLFETHPLINSQLLHHLQHGDVVAKPGLACLDGTGVVFTDGTREEIDLLLFATGYDMSIPYLPEDYLDWTGGRPRMYLNAFAARPGLFGISYIEVNSSAYTLFDRIAHLVAEHLEDARSDPARARAFRRIATTESPDLSGGVDFVGSDRHATYVEVRAYKKELKHLARRMGWRTSPRASSDVGPRPPNPHDPPPPSRRPPGVIMRCLVTGATGFVGGNLVRRLLERGHEVLASGAPGSTTRHLDDLDVPIRLADLTDPEACADLVDGREWVFHVAGDTSTWGRLAARRRRVNVDAAAILADASLAAGVKRFVHTSTLDVHGYDADGAALPERPGERSFFDIGYDYADTKRDGEAAVLARVPEGLDVVVVYPGFMVGPGDHTLQLGRVVRDLQADRLVVAPPGTSSFCDVRAVADGMVEAAERGRTGHGYNLTGHNLTYLEAFTRIGELVGARRTPVRVPGPVLRGAGHAAELASRVTGRAPSIDRGLARYLSAPQASDWSKAAHELDYHPRDLDRAILDAAAWYDEHLPVAANGSRSP